MIKGRLGKISISDYIFDEVLTYVRKKMRASTSIKVANAMLDSPNLRIIHVDEFTFHASFHVFQIYEKLSFTDATTVVLLKNNDIKNLFSFDSGFDGIKDINRLTEWD